MNTTQKLFHQLQDIFNKIVTAAGKEERGRMLLVLNGHSPGISRRPPAMLAKRAKVAGKRSPEQLKSLSTELYRHISKHPGQRIEQIAKDLGVTTKELALPTRKLLDEKKIRSRGQRRATRYSART